MLVICAIFKNEAPYMREWLEFHRIVGVDKFYLYNNSSTDNFRDVLNPYIEAGIVNLVDWPYPTPCQLPAYTDFIARMGGEKMWAAFIDLDEFLFSPLEDKITTILDKYEHPITIGVNWICFGSSGHEKKIPNCLVTETFHWRGHAPSTAGNRVIKSIIRLDQGVGVGGDPHFFFTQYGTITENGDPMSSPFVETHSSNILRINHYKTKSREEWYARALTGKPDRAYYDIDWTHFNDVNLSDVEDHTIDRFLPELKERLKTKDL